ncbi:MAG TPA: CocE/NonD family hydrolase C-terminal non-catalytic domain-containing protein, partial [Legionellaceae bacterium]|nr:CocE/NonD family hydrolase C-terminal non-catalytic domain-containing protein [Legionellaceae bacterium]
FLVFMRKSRRPTLHLKQTPGQYWRYALPLTQQRQKRLYLADKKKLLSTMHDAATNTKIDILKYQPSSGMGVLNWWGEPTSDMRLAQAGTLSYESEKLTHSLTLFGQPNIFIRVAADAPLAHWIVRLEDVNPDGSITFITGGLKNAAQRFSREKPNAIPLHQFFNLHFPLHFTTWTFSKGHKIRVVITNAQFPMIWPTPYPMTTKLMVNGPSKIDLPIAPTPLDKNPFLPPVTTSSVSLPSNTNVLRDIPFTSFKVIHHKDRVIARAKEGYRLKIKQSVYDCLYSVQYSVHNKFPANASFIGKGRVIITQTHPKRMIKIQSFFHIRSDLKYFYVTVTRKIIMPNQKIHSHTWKERIKRDFQ